MILSLKLTATCQYLSWLRKDWCDRRKVFTSMLRSQSIYLAHCANRRKKSRCQTLHRRSTDVRFQRQRGCGAFSLGRRIKRWGGWEITWFRKRRRVGAVGSCLEYSSCCLSSFSSGYYESCNRKALQKHRHKRNVTSHHSLSHLSLLYLNFFNFHHWQTSIIRWLSSLENFHH